MLKYKVITANEREAQIEYLKHSQPFCFLADNIQYLVNDLNIFSVVSLDYLLSSHVCRQSELSGRNSWPKAQALGL